MGSYWTILKQKVGYIPKNTVCFDPYKTARIIQDCVLIPAVIFALNSETREFKDKSCLNFKKHMNGDNPVTEVNVTGSKKVIWCLRGNSHCLQHIPYDSESTQAPI
jgi:hypothetical protein